MTTCVAFEGSYVEEREYAGKSFTQNVYEVVIATAFAVAHFKVCKTKGTGRIKVFTDLEREPLPNWNRLTDPASRYEAIKKNFQWGRTRRNLSKAGATFTAVPFPDSDQLYHGTRNLSAAIDTDETAKKAWSMLMGGFGEAPTYSSMVEAAEEIVVQERAVYKEKKAVVMATVDDGWGVF